MRGSVDSDCGRGKGKEEEDGMREKWGLPLLYNHMDIDHPNKHIKTTKGLAAKRERDSECEIRKGENRPRVFWVLGMKSLRWVFLLFPLMFLMVMNSR